MRIPINLASEPFRKDRPILLASTACAVFLVALLGVLIFLIVNERARAKDTRVAVNQLRNELRTAAQEQAKFDEVLRQPQNAEVLQLSQLLNALIERKSISWTQIFADLEKVMPYDVQLVSVRLPAITSHNEVMLDIVVGSQQPAATIGFFKKVESSPLFGPIEGHSSMPPSQNEKLFRYRVTVNYAQKL
jgi:type IV pilus assembly protein PilN